MLHYCDYYGFVISVISTQISLCHCGKYKNNCKIKKLYLLKIKKSPVIVNLCIICSICVPGFDPEKISFHTIDNSLNGF